MKEELYIAIDDVNGDGSHWRATNDLAEAVDLEFRAGSGTRMMIRLPIGGSVDLYPAIDDDANLLVHKVEDQKGLRLV
ncbi:hypothetical protein D3C80_899990 [compost metagenome]